MGLQPKINHKLSFLEKQCTRCKQTYDSDGFLQSKSIATIDGHSEICAKCANAILKQNDYSWDVLDKLCQYLDIPFIPEKFEEIHQVFGDNAFQKYSEIFFALEYERLDWGKYFAAFKELQQKGLISQELPLIKEERLAQLRAKWGENYSEEELSYLESLYDGILLSQNVNGALQVDQAKKLCKTSLEIDSRIRAGADYDKMLSSYDKLVKIADFTPRNAKNATDFESVGELFHWLEKRGWKNKFYDDVTRDIVDETIKSIQAFNQRLYTNETGIGEEITRRIEALNGIMTEEAIYDTDGEYDLDNFVNEGFNDLMSNDFKEDID